MKGPAGDAPPSHPPAHICHAFATACYIIEAPDGPITLTIGQACPALRALMQAHSAQTMAILTACNPGGRARGQEENLSAQAALEAQARKLGLPMFAGRNTPSAPDEVSIHADYIEPTVILLGIQRGQADTLARTYQQLAWIFAGQEAIPELIWTR